MPSQSFGQLFDQHVSMAFPSCTPFGYFVSHAEMHAATGSLAELAVFALPAVPPDGGDDGVPVEPYAPGSFEPDIVPMSGALVPSPDGDESAEQACKNPLVAKSRIAVRARIEVTGDGGATSVPNAIAGDGPQIPAHRAGTCGLHGSGGAPVTLRIGPAWSRISP